MNKKLLVAAGMGSLLLLGGCASGPDEETANQLSALSSQVDELNSEIAALKSESQMSATKATDAAMSAQDEAARANERIDNIAQSYTK